MRKKPNWRYFSDLICCRNVLKTQVEEKWAKANTLEYTTTNRYKWSAKFICKNRGFEVSVKTFHQWFDMIGNVVVIKSGLKQVVMNFTTGVFKVQKSNDEWTLLYKRQRNSFFQTFIRKPVCFTKKNVANNNFYSFILLKVTEVTACQ